MYPKVSILVPVYKVENFIDKCANSLFVQKYENIEYIFIDDCTPDDSIFRLQKVIEKYPHCDVHVIKHKSNQGLSSARNTGVQHAKGEYIMHVDSDDYLDSPNVIS